MCVKGALIYEFKGDCDSLSLEHVDKIGLKKGQGLKMTLDSTETYNLHRGLTEYFELYGEHGFKPGQAIRYVRCEFNKETFNALLDSHIVAPGEEKRIETARKLIELMFESNNQAVTELLFEMIDADNSPLTENMKTKLLGHIVRGLSDEEYMQKIVDVADPENLISFNEKLSSRKLISAEKYISDNMDDSDEGNWQSYFRDNDWVLSQIFPHPFLFLGDNVYVGGKTHANKGGGLCDFMYKHKISNNASLVEIKTPCTELTGSEYRNGVYSVPTELTGAINQVLKYKNDIILNYHSSGGELSSPPYRVFNPQCVVIAGKMSDMTKEEERRSFEHFRGDHKSVTVITYDELLEKIRGLIDLFSM